MKVSTKLKRIGFKETGVDVNKRGVYDYYYANVQVSSVKVAIRVKGTGYKSHIPLSDDTADALYKYFKVMEEVNNV